MGSELKPMQNHDPTIAARGFILRDLLIGCLIVAVTLAFVESHVDGTKATTRGAFCQSNVRQIGLALNMYATDYDGKLPPTVGSFTGVVTSTHPYLRDDTRFYCPDATVAGGNRKFSYRVPALYAGLPIAAGWPDPYLEGQTADPERTILLYESDTDQGTAIMPSYRHSGGAICLKFTGQTAWERDLRTSK